MASDHVVRTAGPDPSLVLYPRRGRQVLLTIGSVAFVALGIWLILIGRPVPVIAGVLATAVFGLFAAMGMRQLLRRGPALTVDRRGITDTSSAAAAGFVPWEQVTGTGIWEYNKQRIVSVFVRDPEAVIAAATPLARTAMRANLRLAQTPVNIPTTALPLTADELLKELAAFRA